MPSEIIDIPFYYDWTFWAVLISTIAVILSQLPPVVLWFKKPRIHCELYSNISLTQRVGNPNVLMHALIENTGGKKVRVKTLTLDVSKDKQKITTLPINGYIKETTDEKETLFTGFSLEPNEDYSHALLFFKDFQREEENKYRVIEEKLRRDLVTKDEQRLESEDPSKKFIELDPSFVAEAQEFFDERHTWKPGEYICTLNIKTDKDSANLSKSFSFVLFESQCVEFEIAREELKYGSGFWWHKDNASRSVRVEIKEL